jgi:hypothetical protein
VGELQFDRRMRVREHSEYLVRKGLADTGVSRKVEQNRAKQLEASQDSLRLRARYQRIAFEELDNRLEWVALRDHDGADHIPVVADA